MQNGLVITAVSTVAQHQPARATTFQKLDQVLAAAGSTLLVPITHLEEDMGVAKGTIRKFQEDGKGFYEPNLRKVVKWLEEKSVKLYNIYYFIYFKRNFICIAPTTGALLPTRPSWRCTTNMGTKMDFYTCFTPPMKSPVFFS
jgi:hypothetical protein